MYSFMQWRTNLSDNIFIGWTLNEHKISNIEHNLETKTEVIVSFFIKVMLTKII